MVSCWVKYYLIHCTKIRTSLGQPGFIQRFLLLHSSPTFSKALLNVFKCLWISVYPLDILDIVSLAVSCPVSTNCKPLLYSKFL